MPWFLDSQLSTCYSRSRLIQDCTPSINFYDYVILTFDIVYTSELQQFMVTYDKFMKWLEETLNTAISRSEIKHSVGVTESKLEEHKVNIT